MIQGLAVLLLLVPPLDTAQPTLRLPDAVRPVRQAIDLSLDPSRERYVGKVEIDLEIASATNVVWLNAKGLNITEASLGTHDGMRPARPVAGGDDFAGFAYDMQLRAER